MKPKKDKKPAYCKADVMRAQSAEPLPPVDEAKLIAYRRKLVQLFNSWDVSKGGNGI